ncbi:MAG TPA: YdbH domain-containing protein [Opitutaceae bacterium]|nr:YdbH domain-containing protein [Opitutaceae bacterium]
MRFPRLSLAVALGVGGICDGTAAERKIPPIAGELAGNLVLHGWPAFPGLAWKVTAVAAGDATLLRLSATAPGLNLQVEARLPADGGRGSWRVTEGAADVEAWLPVAKAQPGLAALPGDLKMSGAIRLAGEGTWQGSDWAGTVSSTLENGRADSATQGWSAADIGVVSELDVRAGVATLRKAQIRVGSVQAAGLVLQDLRVDVAGADGQRLQVSRAELELLGGHVTLAPFVFDPAAPAVETTADFSRLSLGELARLAPQALAEADGRLDGRIALRWTAAAGFELGAGSLATTAGVPATIRLAAKPGFLTERMPRTISLLPDWLGPVAKWFSPANPAYGTLSDIEMGRQPLAVERLSLKLYPDGPDAARSTLVELAARPTAGGAVDRVDFTVNVAGPLNQVLRLGLNESVQVKVGAGP